MELSDIEKLAKLSRITLTEEEKGSFLSDLKNILAYVGEIKEVSENTKDKVVGELRNVMREDNIYEKLLGDRKEILKEIPDKEGDYLKVKQIF